MTVGEVSRWVESFNFLYKQHLKDNIQTQYMSALVTIKGVNKILSGKGEIPTLTDIYPELFPEEELANQKMNKSVANFINFANSFNKRTKNDNRRA